MSKNNSATNVAIIFDDLTEFFVMQPAINDLKKHNINPDIIVPHDSGYNGLPEHTLHSIDKLGYHPLTDTPKTKSYQVLLTPYPTLDIVNRTNFVYHLKYPYGPLSAKPDPVFLPEWKLSYDGIISFNSYEPTFLSAYGTKYHVVPYWKYNNFKRKPAKASKPILLLLSTFGTDISNIKLFTKSAISEIKKHYKIISKAHHATHFNSDGDDSFEILKNISDEVYDSSASLTELLQIADIVLSDNSGAIFDAIYTGVPVALFCKNPNQRKLGSINTLQYDLINQGVLPHVTNAKDILPMLQSIKPFITKQAKAKAQLFPSFKDNSPSEFTKVIQEYFSKDPKQDYYKAIHDLLIKEYDNLKSTATQSQVTIKQLEATQQSLNSTIHDLERRNHEQATIIQDLYNSTSWKITKPLRKLKKLGKERS